MKQRRDTTQEERVQIVKDCLGQWQKLRRDGLEVQGELPAGTHMDAASSRRWARLVWRNRRGKRKKDQVPRTELEKAQIEIEQLKHKLYLAEMERDLLKKLDEIERERCLWK